MRLRRASGDLVLSVHLGQLDTGSLDRGFAGFRVGIKSPLDDYRAAAIYGRGMNAGVNADGRLFIGEIIDSAPKVDLRNELHLELLRAAFGDRVHRLAARYKRSLEDTPRKRRGKSLADWLTGGVALVCSSGPVEPTPVRQEPIKRSSASIHRKQEAGGTMRFWFADWTVAGSKVEKHEDRTYGPILFTLYTVSRGTLKLSAQFPPLENAPPAGDFADT